MCRSFGPKRRRSRFVRRAVHQNQSLSGLGSGHLLSQGERGDAGFEGARLRHRRVRLYDVHRKFRTSAGVRGERYRIGKP